MWRSLIASPVPCMKTVVCKGRFGVNLRNPIAGVGNRSLTRKNIVASQIFISGLCAPYVRHSDHDFCWAAMHRCRFVPGRLVSPSYSGLDDWSNHQRTIGVIAGRGISESPKTKVTRTAFFERSDLVASLGTSSGRPAGLGIRPKTAMHRHAAVKYWHRRFSAFVIDSKAIVHTTGVSCFGHWSASGIRYHLPAL